MLPSIQRIMERVENKKITLGEDPFLVSRLHLREHGASVPHPAGVGTNRSEEIDLAIFQRTIDPSLKYQEGADGVLCSKNVNNRLFHS